MAMTQEDADRDRQKLQASSATGRSGSHLLRDEGGAEITGILDERIDNLREAIAEIDDALAGRKQLSQQFLEQIDREAEEARRHLKTLKEPWQMGFYPEIEFMRLSLHKSLTSRAKERRGEELKYWENGVNLAKERRKFLDEYKALLAAKRRLVR